jgi:hypothetical protein
MQALRSEGEAPVRLGSVVAHGSGQRVAYTSALKL